jgi:hypothetical protein
MNHEKIKQYKVWFSSGLSFEILGDKLKSIGLIESYHHDYENVYEWLEAKTKNEDLDLNISRKHCDGEGIEFEPIHVMAMFSENEPVSSVIEEIAYKISKTFNCKVYLGFIENSHGDEYEYTAMSEIHS